MENYFTKNSTTYDGVVLNNGMNIFSGEVVNRPIINSGGSLFIFSGGTASSATINDGGYLCVDRGGKATDVSWTPGYGHIIWEAGAKISFISNYSGVYICDYNGLVTKTKKVNEMSLGHKDSMYIMSGGLATNTSVDHISGSLYVYSGGVANDTTVNNGKMCVFVSGTAKNTTVRNGELTIFPGGSANNIALHSGGSLYLCEGGSATVASWTPGEAVIEMEGNARVTFSSKYSGVYIGDGEELLTRTNKADALNVKEGEFMYVMSGGTAKNATVEGAAYVFSGGTASNTSIEGFYASMGVYSGGTANNTSVYAGNINVASGGTANIVYLDGRGGLFVENGGLANSSFMKNDGDITILSGGKANGISTTGGYIYVEDGGIATNILLDSDTFLHVSKGGIAVNITLKTDCSIFVESGGMVGNITFLGGELDYEDGAILNYDYKGGKTSSMPLIASEDADSGWNNWLYDTKDKETNDEVTDSEAADINADTWEIVVDAEEISYEDRHGNLYSNFVGYGDAVDFSRIYLENAAKLSLSIMATDAARITIWRLNETWKKDILTYSQKSFQSTKLALNKQTGIYRADTKPLLLEAGEYYISVESTNAKKGGAAYYSITVNQDASAFFDRGDNSDDWTDMRWNGAFSDKYGDAGTIDEYTESVIEDGWVGYGDEIDCARIHLDDAAKLSFSLDATDAAKFTIYRLTESVKKSVVSYSLKSLQSTTLKKPKNADEHTATTKALLLESGDYYIAMESTNAKKGGSADYNVSVNGRDTAFFSDADDGWNNWLYDKKTKELNEEVAYHEPVEISPYTERVQVDADAVCHEDANGTTWDNYVGYGDEFDYAKIQLESDARLSFTITATDAAKFTVYTLIEKVNSWTGIVSYKLETIQSASLKKAKGDSLYRYSVTMMIPGGINYYVSMQSTNAKKGGCAYYNVEINRNKSSFDVDYPYGVRDQLEAGDADTLSLPETDNLAKNGMLSESGNGILASL